MLHFKAYSYSGADDRHSMQQFLLSTLSNILCYKVPSVTFRDLLTMKNSSQWRGLKMTALSSYVKSYDLRGTVPQPPLPFHCNACSIIIIIYSLWSGYTWERKRREKWDYVTMDNWLKHILTCIRFTFPKIPTLMLLNFLLLHTQIECVAHLLYIQICTYRSLGKIRR